MIIIFLCIFKINEIMIRNNMTVILKCLQDIIYYVHQKLVPILMNKCFPNVPFIHVCWKTSSRSLTKKLFIINISSTILLFIICFFIFNYYYFYYFLLLFLRPKPISRPSPFCSKLLENNHNFTNNFTNT